MIARDDPIDKRVVAAGYTYSVWEGVYAYRSPLNFTGRLDNSTIVRGRSRRRGLERRLYDSFCGSPAAHIGYKPLQPCDLLFRRRPLQRNGQTRDLGGADLFQRSS